MRSLLRFSTETRLYVNRVYDQLLHQMNGVRPLDAGEFGRRFATTLVRDMRAGFPEPLEALTTYTSEAARRDITRAKKQADSITIRFDGQPMTLTKVIADRKQRVDGSLDNATQLRLFYSMTWEQLARALSREIGQRQKLDGKIRFYYAVLDLHERFPEAVTPADACEMAGVTVDAITDILEAA